VLTAEENVVLRGGGKVIIVAADNSDNSETKCGVKKRWAAERIALEGAGLSECVCSGHP
jgi:hypothetical protein